MDLNKIEEALAEKRALLAKLALLDSQIEEATTGSTFSDHEWKLDTDAGLLGIQVNGEHVVHLAPSDVGDMLAALSVFDKEKVSELIAPFDVVLPEESSTGMDDPISQWLREAKLDAALQPPHARTYLRLRQGPDKSKLKGIPGRIEVGTPFPTITDQVNQKLMTATEPVVVLELMRRTTSTDTKRILFKILRDDRTP